MANNLVQAEANRLLDATLGTATYTAPTAPMKLAVNTANSTATATGTEVTGGSYARQTIAFSSAAAGAASNSGSPAFAAMPAATSTGVDIYDNNGTPRRGWWGPLGANKTTASGDTLSFAIGAVTVALA